MFAGGPGDASAAGPFQARGPVAVATPAATSSSSASTAPEAGPSLAPLVVVSAERLAHEVKLSLDLAWKAVHPTVNTSDCPKARCWAAADACDGKLVIQGGYSGSNSYYNDLYVFHPEPQAWQRVWCTGMTPPPLYAHTLNCVDGKIVLCCGGTGRNYSNSIFVMERLDFSSATGRWVEATFDRQPTSDGIDSRWEVPSRRGAHATAVVNGQLWLFGGDNGHGTYFHDLYRIDLTEMTCEKIRTKGTKPAKRGWHSMVSCRNKLYVFGGTDGSATFNDLHVFDTTTLTWSCPHCTGEPAEPLFSHSAVMIGHEMLLFGGSNGLSKSQNHAYVFDTDRLCWVHPRLSGDVPSPRYGHSCVVLKEKLLLYGGFSGGAFAAQLYMMSLSQVKKEVQTLPPELINTVIQDYRQLLANGTFADVEFDVDGHVIKAHRCVLSARSHHFARMFCSGMREAAPNARIPVPGMQYSVFMAVLEFLYSGCALSLTQQNALDVLVAADMFGLDLLKVLAGNVLLRTVTIHNVVHIYALAEQYNAHKLKSALMKFIKKNRGLLSQTSENIIFIDDGTQ